MFSIIRGVYQTGGKWFCLELDVFKHPGSVSDDTQVVALQHDRIFGYYGPYFALIAPHVVWWTATGASRVQMAMFPP